jgi:uncharacterized protein with GYD domain
MSTFMWKVAYTQQGLAGIMKQGGSDRADQIRGIVEKNGGSLQAFYFAFGDTDAYVIADLPNDTVAAAISLAVASSGTAATDTVKLITPSELDEARAMQTGYVPPGA